MEHRAKHTRALGVGPYAVGDAKPGQHIYMERVLTRTIEVNFAEFVLPVKRKQLSYGRLWGYQKCTRGIQSGLF